MKKTTSGRLARIIIGMAGCVLLARRGKTRRVVPGSAVCLAFLAVGILLGVGQTAQAALITLDNPDFETPVLPVSTNVSTSVPDWTSEAGGSGATENYTLNGPWYASNQPGRFPAMTTQTYAVNNNSGDNYHHAYQSPTGLTIQPNTVYTVTHQVWKDNGHPSGTPPPPAWPSGLVGVGLALDLANPFDSVLDVAASFSQPLPDGSGPQTWTVTYTTGSNPGSLGSQLRVYLYASNGGVNGLSGIAYDNLTVDVSERIPEPTSGLLLALAGAGLALRRRRATAE